MVRLKRELGLLSAVGIGIGAVIGAGIFVVTGIATDVEVAAMLVGLIVAGLAATLSSNGQ